LKTGKFEHLPQGIFMLLNSYGDCLFRGAYKSLARPGRKQAYVSIRMACISFGALPCRKKKLDNSSRLDVVEITRVPDMLPELVSFLVGLRTYQHPGIID